jgi:hypothetical protein
VGVFLTLKVFSPILYAISHFLIVFVHSFLACFGSFLSLMTVKDDPFKSKEFLTFIFDEKGSLLSLKNVPFKLFLILFIPSMLLDFSYVYI